MSQEKGRLRAYYQLTSMDLSSGVISSNSDGAYVAFVDSEYNRLLYIIDSKYDLGAYKGDGHLFGHI